LEECSDEGEEEKDDTKIVEEGKQESVDEQPRKKGHYPQVFEALQVKDHSKSSFFCQILCTFFFWVYILGSEH